jgi:hypothetical protein
MEDEYVGEVVVSVDCRTHEVLRESDWHTIFVIELFLDGVLYDVLVIDPRDYDED